MMKRYIAVLVFVVLAVARVPQAFAFDERIGECHATERDGNSVPKNFVLRHEYPGRLLVEVAPRETAAFTLNDASLLSTSLGVLSFGAAESTGMRIVLTPFAGNRDGRYTGTLHVPRSLFGPELTFDLSCDFQSDGLSWLVAVNRRRHDVAAAVADDTRDAHFVPPVLQAVTPAETRSGTTAAR